MPRLSAEAKFWAQVTKTPDCWLWTGRVLRRGYGQFYPTRKAALAHRFSWELANGPIIGDLCVLHRCDNPPCCNPDHLFLGTRADNNADMMRKGRNRQPKGERHGRTMFTNEIVKAIRFLHKAGVPHTVQARFFGVTDCTIGFIARNVTWRHVKPDVFTDKERADMALVARMYPDGLSV